ELAALMLHVRPALLRSDRQQLEPLLVDRSVRGGQVADACPRLRDDLVLCRTPHDPATPAALLSTVEHALDEPPRAALALGPGHDLVDQPLGSGSRGSPALSPEQQVDGSAEADRLGKVPRAAEE